MSALCFALFFWSRFLGGTAGWLEVVLFVLGIACIMLEIFVVPGFGVFGVSGGLLVFASLVLASQTFGNLEPNEDLRVMSRSVGTLAGSIVSVIIAAALLNRFLPNIPFLNSMILTPPDYQDDPDAPRLPPELTSPGQSRYGHDGTLVGQRGQAVSTLRPAGKAQFGDDWIDVVSDGPYIEEGTEVEVLSVAGNKIVVRAV